MKRSCLLILATATLVFTVQPPSRAQARSRETAPQDSRTNNIKPKLEVAASNAGEVKALETVFSCTTANATSNLQQQSPECRYLNQLPDGWLGLASNHQLTIKWMNGCEVLFEEKGPFFLQHRRERGEASLWVDSRTNPREFNFFYQNPQTRILQAPMLRPALIGWNTDTNASTDFFTFSDHAAVRVSDPSGAIKLPCDQIKTLLDKWRAQIAILTKQAEGLEKEIAIRRVAQKDCIAQMEKIAMEIDFLKSRNVPEQTKEAILKLLEELSILKTTYDELAKKIKDAFLLLENVKTKLDAVQTQWTNLRFRYTEECLKIDLPKPIRP